MQQVYKELVNEILECCKSRLKERLVVAYLVGSVAADEAVPDASNLHVFGFLESEPTRSETEWLQEKERQLSVRYPSVKGIHVVMFSTELLETENWMMKFIFRYNAVRVHGVDILAEMEGRGVEIPKPKPELAFRRLKWVKECVDGLANGVLPFNLFKGDMSEDLSQLSSDDFAAARKLARCFVVLEGAYLLMAFGHFDSFKQESVLQGLKSNHPQWRAFLETTENLLNNPFESRIPPADYIRQLLPFAHWTIETIELRSVRSAKRPAPFRCKMVR